MSATHDHTAAPAREMFQRMLDHCNKEIGLIRCVKPKYQSVESLTELQQLLVLREAVAAALGEKPRRER